ncbi:MULTISPECIES: LacI family DNA-binding transcriptional regulator [Geobacillus]|nr:MULTISPECIES: LacI family DNA-binding transcriptional regulator [Geobacillus]MED4974594.1 LacI family DNA-binding transcriptional regulator [Geobacillus thermoleovorans]
MANIRDLAKEAGVSVAAVSRVLNGYPYVSEEKRKTVGKQWRSSITRKIFRPSIWRKEGQRLSALCFRTFIILIFLR